MDKKVDKWLVLEVFGLDKPHLLFIDRSTFKIYTLEYIPTTRPFIGLKGNFRQLGIKAAGQRYTPGSQFADP